MSVTPNLPKRDPSASYMTVSLAYNSVPLESNYPECKTTKQIFYTSAGCAPGTKKVKAECLPKISEDHRQTLQQLMHLRKVYNCPLSCQYTRNCLLCNITHSWYTQPFQTTIRWKNLSTLLLKMLYRPLVWATKKLWVKIRSKFVALCCCTELRCQVSHVRRQRILILNHCNQALQQ